MITPVKREMSLDAEKRYWRLNLVLQPGGLEDKRQSPVDWRFSSRPSSWRPPTDVFETDETIIVRVEIAGMREEDFMIELDGKVLAIRGLRPDIPERRAYHQMEIRFGEFGVEVELPALVDLEQAQADYDNGFLRVILPKSLPRQIRIEESDR
jgi:HSP20 family protein